jgi:hypothetical protein
LEKRILIEWSRNKESSNSQPLRRVGRQSKYRHRSSPLLQSSSPAALPSAADCEVRIKATTAHKPWHRWRRSSTGGGRWRSRRTTPPAPSPPSASREGTPTRSRMRVVLAAGRSQTTLPARPVSSSRLASGGLLASPNCGRLMKCASAWNRARACSAGLANRRAGGRNLASRVGVAGCFRLPSEEVRG